jgi:hypothetical protein
MARPNTGLNFNIAQLERILEERRTEVSRLERQRAELQRKLDGLDRQIGKLNGGLKGMRGRLGAGGGGRARNAHSLVETLEEVMRSNGKPMRVGEIVDAHRHGLPQQQRQFPRHRQPDADQGAQAVRPGRPRVVRTEGRRRRGQVQEGQAGRVGVAVVIGPARQR